MPRGKTADRKEAPDVPVLLSFHGESCRPHGIVLKINLTKYSIFFPSCQGAKTEFSAEISHGEKISAREFVHTGAFFAVEFSIEKRAPDAGRDP